MAKITTFVYDADGRQVATVDPLGNRTSFAYDAASRRRRAIDPLGNIATSIFDLAGRAIAVIDPLGQRMTLAYNSTGQRVRVTDPLKHTSTSLYDAAGRPAAVLDPLANRVSQVLDPVGRAIAVTDPRGNRTSFAYDAAGRPTRTVDPLGNRTSFAYDAAGRLTRRVDGRTLATTYLYDITDRFTGIKYQDGTRATMAYDAAGRRTALADWTGRTSFAYDAAGRLTQSVTPAGLRLTYAYDAEAERTRMSCLAGLFTYSYDNAGRLVQLINPNVGPANAADVTSWAYDAAGRVTAKRLASTYSGTSLRTSYAYDAADRLSRLVNLSSAAATLSSFAYAYDAAGNRTRVVESSGDVTTWAYDATYQLTAERRGGAVAYAVTYTYDPSGNRARKLDGGSPTTYAYDGANQLSRYQASAGYVTNSYDGAGNLRRMTSAGSPTTYTWDGENRLTQVRLPAGVVDTFAYNGDGLRVQKQSVASGATTKFVWDGQNVLLETDATNTLSMAYTSTPSGFGNLLSQASGNKNPTVSYFQFDGTGSTRQVVQSGGVADSYAYRAFGEPASSSGFVSPAFRFVGEPGYYLDKDPGTYYVRARHYDTVTGRWLSRDPIGFTGMDWNLYRYVYNGPVDTIDPSGLKQICGVYVFVYTGSWCVDESVYEAAIGAAGEVVNCWWDCEVATHSNIGGAILATTEVVCGATSIAASRVPKNINELLDPRSQTGVARSFRPASRLQLKALARGQLGRQFARSGLVHAAKGFFVVTSLVEAGISIKDRQFNNFPVLDRDRITVARTTTTSQRTLPQ